MEKLSRRDFLLSVSAATLAAAAMPAYGSPHSQRVFVASSKPGSILVFDWDPASAALTPVSQSGLLTNVEWVALRANREFLFAASEVDSFNGKPTGEVASYRVVNAEVQPLSARNSAGKGTCHVALDRTGRVLLAADYFGGSAASFLVTDGRLSPAVWTEQYTEHGPNAARQQSAHAHFGSFSPDNRFAYMNDLGGDCIHIYSLDTETAMMHANGIYHADPGCGPRTLHFHPNGHTTYSINELSSTVDLLEWSKSSGGLTRKMSYNLLPDDYHGPTNGCDTVISRDGKYVYFANRGNNTIYSFHANTDNGKLTPLGSFDCGGKTPRHFTFDPTERWMLVANQNSDQISIFRRNPQTGLIRETGKSVAVGAPMCIVFA
jgi:6-phosphogluconolactonase